MNAKNYHRLYLMIALTLLGIITVLTAASAIQQLDLEVNAAHLYIGTVIAIFGVTFAIIFWALTGDMPMTQGQLWPLITLTMTREEAMMVCNLLLYFGEIATNLEVRPQIQDTLDKMDDREILATGVGAELYEQVGFRLKKEIEQK